MTDIQINPADLDTTLGDAHFHAKCCVEDRILCGLPFHPELVGEEDFDCKACEEVTMNMMCGSRKHPHWHCAVMPVRRCPEHPS